MMCLIVGAGAVGQIFGRHLSLGGAEVAFYVRPSRMEAMGHRLNFYPLTRRSRPEWPATFDDFDLLCEPAEVARRGWDQIYLCVPSPALRSSLLTELAAAAGGATIVEIQPGLGDRRLLLDHFSPNRLVSGMVTFASYPGPLPGETLPQPGICYYFPPLIASPFSGPANRTRAVVESLSNGGVPARVHPDVGPLSASLVAAQTALMAGMELSGWSFKRLRRGAWLGLAIQGAGEAISVAADFHQGKPPLILGPLRPVTLWLAAILAPRLYPFSLEAFLRLHYNKLREQSRSLLATYIEEGQARQLPVRSLEKLQQAILALPN